ncbi:MAG: HAD family phosphatase [Gemmataceae bacterium]|nr:HAD family phosphatase [Gemmataceae bacterium]
MLNQQNAVIWDVDGTMVDTAELHYQAWCVLAREIGRPFTRADFTATFGWRNPEIIPKLWGIHDESEVAALGDRKELYYRAEAKKGVALLPGVQQLMEALGAAGFRQAVGSSAPRHNIDLILDITKVGQHAQAIVSMEDTRRGKPDPEVFLLAAQRLGVEPGRCLVIEDAPVGVMAAKAGGMRCVAVTCVGHHPVEKLHAAGADLVAPTLEQVAVEQIRELLGS